MGLAPFRFRYIITPGWRHLHRRYRSKDYPPVQVLDKKRTLCRVFFLVPKVGLEPTRCRHLRILSPTRLPIPPFRQIYCALVRLPKHINTNFLTLQEICGRYFLFYLFFFILFYIIILYYYIRRIKFTQLCPKMMNYQRKIDCLIIDQQ